MRKSKWLETAERGGVGGVQEVKTRVGGVSESVADSLYKL